MSDAQFAVTLLELCRVVLGGHPERPELVPTKAEMVTYQREKNVQQRYVIPERLRRHQAR